MSAARPSTRPPHGIRVAVAWASPRAQGVVEVDLPPGATVADAVAAVRALERAGVAPTEAGYAIYGQTARPGKPLVDGDRVEIRSHIGATYGKAVLAHGIRPDTLVIPGQFDHWATPVAKDFGMPSLNTVAPMSLELTDATGSGADIVRVAIRRLEGSTVQ